MPSANANQGLCLTQIAQSQLSAAELNIGAQYVNGNTVWGGK